MGGRIFKYRTRRIQEQHIPHVLKLLANAGRAGMFPSLEYLENNLLGSAGNADTSGDLDINMDERLFDLPTVASILVHQLGQDSVVVKPGNNQIFTCVPVMVNDALQHEVQVDFMFGDHAWQQFSYFSPGRGSRFKGLFRTELIKAAIAFRSDHIDLDDDGSLISRFGPTFFHDRGVVWRPRTRPWRRDGFARVKDFREIAPEEYQALYPDCGKIYQKTIRTPREVNRLIFEDDAPWAPRFYSYETLVRALRNKFHTPSADGDLPSNDFNVILQIFLERLNSLKADIPLEILDEISKRAQQAGCPKSVLNAEHTKRKQLDSQHKQFSHLHGS